jgi:chromate transporter
MIGDALGLFWHFMLLACVAVGGVSTVMPDLYRYVVDEKAMLSAREFSDLYALAQAAPGPNALWVTLVGLQARGWLGAVATTLAILIPATVFTLVAIRLHARHADTPFVAAVRRGLGPVALGFMLASGWLLLAPVAHDWRGYAAALIALVVALRTRFNPLWLLAAGALAGVAGVI